MALLPGRLSLPGKTAVRRRRTRATAVTMLVASGLTMVAPAWAASGWHTTATPDPGANFLLQVRGMNGVVAFSATNAWAVSQYYPKIGAVVRPLLLHWTGTAWTSVTPPTPAGGSGTLRFLSANGPDDIWALGGQASVGARFYLLHFNGHVWKAVSTAGIPAKFFASSFAADTPSSVWIGGYSSATGGPAAEHWDGVHWTASKAPLPVVVHGGQFSGISMIPGTHRPLAVGYYYPVGGVGFIPYAAQWSGGAWHKMAMGTATLGQLQAVVMLSTTNGWAVGTRYPGDHTFQTFTQHWNGQSWTAASTPNRPGVSNTLLGITAGGSHDVWAVGYSTAGCPVNCRRSLAEHFNGTTWSISKTPNPAVGTNTYDAFWAAAAVPGTTQVWAVGTRGPARQVGFAQSNFAALAN